MILYNVKSQVLYLFFSPVKFMFLVCHADSVLTNLRCPFLEDAGCGGPGLVWLLVAGWMDCQII